MIIGKFLPPRVSFATIPDKTKILYSAAFMIFFWALYDGIISYITPILIENHGFSTTLIGLIIATSSAAGALFDFLISKIFKNTHFLRLFLILLGICFAYPFLLWSASGVAFFVFCMSLWGLYYDIFNFGLFDFVSNNSDSQEHCQNFGIVTVFKSLGYLIAPLIAAYFITDQQVNFTTILLSFFFLIGSSIFYILLTSVSNGNFHRQPEAKRKGVDWLRELRLWQGVSHILFPVLVFNAMLYIFDATFWTIGPIFSENFKNIPDFGGLFMTCYTLPTLLTGWFVGPITRRFGKKRTAYVSFLLGSILLVTLGFLKNPYLILAVTLISCTFGSMAWPAIKGAYVDYITESKKYQNEIEGLNDFTTNIGYVIGPIFAGLAADTLGIANTFSFLGVFNIILVVILLFVTPKHIRVALKETFLSPAKS